jgi:hypothetical protein
MGIYVLNWEHSKGVNIIINQGAGQIEAAVPREKENINKIIDEIKKNLNDKSL